MRPRARRAYRPWVNTVGAEAGNSTLVMGRILPYGQDTAEAGVASAWGASVRQLWILDRSNRQLEVLDLTAFPLSEPANLRALRARLLRLAAAP
jgi:hypothetical protein